MHKYIEINNLIDIFRWRFWRSFFSATQTRSARQRQRQQSRKSTIPVPNQMYLNRELKSEVIPTRTTGRKHSQATRDDSPGERDSKRTHMIDPRKSARAHTDGRRTMLIGGPCGQFLMRWLFCRKIMIIIADWGASLLTRKTLSDYWAQWEGYLVHTPAKSINYAKLRLDFYIVYKGEHFYTYFF